MVKTATIEPSRAAGEWQGIVKFVGNKGRALAVNLVEDGYQVRVFDRNRERIMAMESTDAMEPGPF
jgi:6-phosphogluconate dehydrogenase